MAQEIGWSIQDKLLYQIKQEIKKNRQSAVTVNTTTTTP